MIKVASNLEKMVTVKVSRSFDDNLIRDVGIGAAGGAGLGALIQALRGKSVLKGLGLGALGGGLGGAGYNYLTGEIVNPYDKPPVMEFGTGDGPLGRDGLPKSVMPEASYATGPTFRDALTSTAVEDHGRSVGMQNALEAADRIDRENTIKFEDIRNILESEPLPNFNLFN